MGTEKLQEHRFSNVETSEGQENSFGQDYKSAWRSLIPMLLCAGLCSWLVMACSPSDPNSGVTEWKDMTHSDRLTFMGTKVFQKVRKMFEEHDPARYGGGKFACTNCHGPEPKARKYKMPNPALLKLDPDNLPGPDTKDNPHFKKYGTFMREKIVPTMKELFATVKNPIAEKFFCFHCHTKTTDNPPGETPTEKAGETPSNPDAGTPETGTPEAGPTETVAEQGTGGVSFKNDIAPLFSKYGCTGCHGGSGGLSLGTTPHKNIVGVASTQKPDLKRVEPGQPEKSMLYLKVEAKTKGTAAPAGSPMPLNSKTVSQEDLDKLKAWITEGAKDN